MTDRNTREHVLDSLLDTIAAHGLERATIREVAAAAEVSIGTVQYYCRAKEEMLRLAFEHVIDRPLARAQAVPREGVVDLVLRRALQEFLPLDEERTRETRVYLAFAARAVVDRRIAEMQHASMARLRALCADALRLGQDRGQAHRDVDADRFGAATVALLDGLCLQLLSDPDGIDPSTAVAVIDAHIATHFRGP